ncbi:serine/threonine-protein kinase [Streptomyces megasporus]|uniref:serine/threonine-protein kinase n=1 Tax=Streptomyces megasporus TaxID=44060 RepID=UPI0004E1F611|nr:serine/threonine-protein kinase [Streptomyces megasporus]
MSGGRHEDHTRPGRVVDGRFELLERLGSGGMGTVWRARDTVLDREVALKEVRPPDPASAPGPASDPADEDTASRRARERVLREARALARINHPHVVTVHHIVDSRPYPWIVMELLPGPSLQDRIADGPLRPREAARLGRQILSALRAAHAAGIHHRDVKPANVLLRGNVPAGPGGPDGGGGLDAVLTDFGIAAVQGSTSLTATGEIVGSPEYIAPERIRGGDDDPASDLWSLAMTLYVCVEGASPLRRPTALATLAAVLDEPIPPPVRSGPLAPALTAMLVRDPAARPDAERFDALLAEAEAGRSAPHLMETHTAPRPAVPPPPPGAPFHPPTLATAPRPDVPGTGATVPTASPGRRGWVAPAVGAAVCAALIAASAYAFTAFTGDGEEGRGAGAASSPAASPPDAPSASPSDAPSSEGNAKGPSEPSSDSPAGSSAPATPEPSATPTPSADRTPPDDGAPIAGEESVDTWVAQLFSEPVSSGTAVRDKRLAAVRAKAPGARVLLSDDFASLRPGYWMIYAPGPFPDGHAAARWCREHGMTKQNECQGRYLSRDADDRVYQCVPTTSGPGGSGRCTRP